MDHQCASMPTIHGAVVVVATALLVLGEVSSALAQQTTPLPTAPKAQAKKPSTSLPAAPPATSQPAAPQAGAQPQGAELTKQQFIFSPWTKICGKDGPYSYLPASVGAFPTPPELLATMQKLGYSDCKWQPYTFGIAGLYTAVRSPVL